MVYKARAYNNGKNSTGNVSSKSTNTLSTYVKF